MPTLGQIAELVAAGPVEDPDRSVTGVATLVDAGADQIAFCGSERYAREIASTRALAVVVSRRIRVPSLGGRGEGRTGDSPTLLIVPDADAAMVKVLELFAPPVPRPPTGVHPSAQVAASASIGRDVAIGPNVVVGERCVIGHGCVLHPGVCLGDDVTLGEKTTLFPNVVIRERITVGCRVIIHASSVLGTDGFGYRWNGTQHAKVPQIGTVVIEDDVEIGSCTCIDRAKVGETRVGQGTKIDNLVQVGHNVRIGRHCIIVGGVGIAGSASMGDGVVIGGGAGLRDHIKLGDGVRVAAFAGVPDDVKSGEAVGGAPAVAHRQFLREQAAIRRLPELRVQVQRLQEEVDRLRQQISES